MQTRLYIGMCVEGEPKQYRNEQGEATTLLLEDGIRTRKADGKHIFTK